MNTECVMNHTIHIDERKNAVIEGVTDVISFDEMSVVLETVQGRMTVNGIGLKVKQLTLDKGVLGIEGTVNELYYTESAGNNKKGFLGKLMR